MLGFECSALIFDLDGVLVDSLAVIERHWRRWAASRELPVSRVLEVAPGRPTLETIRLVAPHLDADKEAAELTAAEAPDTGGLVAIDGALELLAALPPEGWAVVTSGIRITAETRLSHTGLPLPRVLISADDVSRGKPDPEGYLTAAERLGAHPSECVVIEDAPTGLAAAKAAGMRTIGVAFQFGCEDLAEADATVDRLNDLRVEVEASDGKVSMVLHARES
jgi:sugar-phosphatase